MNSRKLHRCLDGQLCIVGQTRLIGGEQWACQIEPVALIDGCLHRRTYSREDNNLNTALPIDQLEEVTVEFSSERYGAS